MKSQGKVREFREKSGNFSEIKKSFFRNRKLKRKFQNFDTFQKCLILRGQIPGKKYIKCLMESQGKLENSQGIVREF